MLHFICLCISSRTFGLSPHLAIMNHAAMNFKISLFVSAKKVVVILTGIALNL